MAVRTGMINTIAIKNIHDSSIIIARDIIEDGGSKTDAYNYIKKLVSKSMNEVSNYTKADDIKERKMMKRMGFK